MTGFRDLLRDYRDRNLGSVAFADNPTSGSIIGLGNISNGSLTLENVHYVPQLKYNLLSVGQVCSKNIDVLFNKHEVLFLKPGIIIPPELVLFRSPKVNGTYKLDMDCTVDNANQYALMVKAPDAEAQLWHRRLGHVYFKNINKLVRRDLVRGLPHKRFDCTDSCLSCAKGKQH